MGQSAVAIDQKVRVSSECRACAGKIVPRQNLRRNSVGEKAFKVLKIIERTARAVRQHQPVFLWPTVSGSELHLWTLLRTESRPLSLPSTE